MDSSQRTARSITVSEHVYRALLAAYPKDFRQYHDTEMVQLFRDLCRDRLETHGMNGLLSLWLRTLLELVKTAVRERMRKGSSSMFASAFSSRNVIRQGGIAAIVGGAFLIAVWLFAITTNLPITGMGPDLLMESWLARIALPLLLVAGLLSLYICVMEETENDRRARLLATVGLVPLLVVVAVSILGAPILSLQAPAIFLLQTWALMLATGIIVVSSILAKALDRKAVFPIFLILLWVPPLSELVSILGDAIYYLTIEPVYLALSPQVRNETGLPNPTLSGIDSFLHNVLYFALPSILVGIGWILLGQIIRNSASPSRDDSGPGLKELQQLHAAGVLTDEEFSSARLRLLNG